MTDETEIIDLTEGEKEEPWCANCRKFTDYRRKWSTFPRADLDGGSYIQNEEIPHCVTCDSRMHYLGVCRRVAWGFRFICFFSGVISTLLCFVLFTPSAYSLLGWIFSILLLGGVSKLPAQSLYVLKQYNSKQSNHPPQPM